MKLRWLILTGLVVIGITVWLLSDREGDRSSRVDAMTATNVEQAQGPNAVYEKVLALEAREKQWDETVWSLEIEAQRHEVFIQNFWDAFNATSNKWPVIEQFALPRLILGSNGVPEKFQHQVSRVQFSGSISLDAAAWREQCQTWQRAGEQVEHLEFRHLAFTPAQGATSATSRFYFQAAAVNSRTEQRTHLSGEISVDWNKAGESLSPVKVDASKLVLHQRVGSPWFSNTFTAEVSPLPGMFVIDPLLVHDLDGNGTLEIILASRNLVFQRSNQGEWTSQALVEHPPQAAWTSLIVDLDRDGQRDLLAADREGLLFFAGHQGKFNGAPRRIWHSPLKILHPQVLTAGDLDGDGDIDLFLGQYKIPFIGGQIPTPFDNANDGFPSCLLINQGDGTFREETEARGLGRLRSRRCYSASFVDVDLDHRLDLLVVSDFHGIDFYRNQGEGILAESDPKFFQARPLLGMSHSIADFNGDGRPDFFAVGMNSPVADRLAHSRITPPGQTDFVPRLTRITEGNRLFLSGKGAELWEEKILPPALRRTGWSWAAAPFDLDNDGDLDVYLANGHESNRLVRDYEFHFWGHDIWVGTSRSDPGVAGYYNTVARRLRGGGLSYGGYEKNRLLLSDKQEWLEVASLFGVAQESDARNLLAEDLNQDGILDLIWTTVEIWPRRRQTLQIWEGRAPQADGVSSNHWIGLQLELAGDRVATSFGARVELKTSKGSQYRWLVAGDGFRSQSSGRVHFGLGVERAVQELVVHWVDGKQERIMTPAVNRYHRWRSGGKGSVQ